MLGGFFCFFWSLLCQWTMASDITLWRQSKHWNHPHSFFLLYMGASTKERSHTSSSAERYLKSSACIRGLHISQLTSLDNAMQGTKCNPWGVVHSPPHQGCNIRSCVGCRKSTFLIASFAKIPPSETKCRVALEKGSTHCCAALPANIKIYY